MKTILTIMLSIFSIANLNAFCAWNGFKVFPSGNTINQNSIIILEGYGESQNIIKELNKKFPIYLVNGKQKVKLKIKEILIGQLNLTQAVLIPETKLKIGLNYTLFIENLPYYEPLKRWNSKLSKHESIFYNVVKGKDKLQPIFKTIPKEIKKTNIQYGCGPAKYVEFDCQVEESSKYLVKTTVRSLKSGNETTYYIEPKNGIILIGHDMCSGEFTFNEGDNYEIEFSLMDELSNLTKWTGERIKFTKPLEESVNEENN